MSGKNTPTPQLSAAILSIGDELVFGESVDTNSAWLSRRLLDLGVKPIEHATAPDDLDAIVSAMRRLAGVADILITTGGLGPTDDDLTRTALAQALDEPLVEDALALSMLKKRFKKIGSNLLQTNRVQTMRPQSARVLPNERGTAPGIVATMRRQGRTCEVFCLPGPPREMKPIFDMLVAPALRQPDDRVLRTRTLHVFGLAESVLPEKLGGLMERGRNPIVGTGAQTSFVTCKIRYEGAEAQANRAMAQAEQQVRDALGPYIFGCEDNTLASVVLDLLRAKGERVVTAESCTGGLVATLLTDEPGSSDCFAGGWVTYSNELKESELGVSGELIERFGAVSEPVARAMAEGALDASARSGAAAHAIAITGVAGPTGGSDDKPVGTVYIARATRGDSTEVRLFRFSDDRVAVRIRSAMSALAMLRLKLIGRTDVRLLWEQTDA